jgi:poly-gamma-glutamate synthesis protein (capsule biosynthesis protein)
LEYTHLDGPSTSYIVTVYGSDAEALSKLGYPDQHVTYFGGDVLLGRLLTPALLDRSAAARIVTAVKRITNGQSLVVNLEGVILPDPPVRFPRDRHVMDDALAGPVLHDMNVIAAGLANNHSFDLGRDGLAASAKALTARHIRPLLQADIADFGSFRLVALNFIGSGDARRYPVAQRADARSKGDIARLCKSSALPPIVALLHWGTEYTSAPGPDERAIADELGVCGISLIIGAHSHRASEQLELVAGGEALMLYSLGNLAFDQSSSRASSMVLELRVFEQGTFAARLIPAPNLYEAAMRP